VREANTRRRDALSRRLAASLSHAPGAAGLQVIRYSPGRASAAFRAQALVVCLKTAGLGRYDDGWWGEVFPNVSASDFTVFRERGRACSQRMHKVRPDLGRLVSVPEILPVRPPLSGVEPVCHAWLSGGHNAKLAF
jgi:hypothetical protein